MITRPPFWRWPSFYAGLHSLMAIYAIAVITVPERFGVAPLEPLIQVVCLITAAGSGFHFAYTRAGRRLARSTYTNADQETHETTEVGA